MDGLVFEVYADPLPKVGPLVWRSWDPARPGASDFDRMHDTAYPFHLHYLLCPVNGEMNRRAYRTESRWRWPWSAIHCSAFSPSMPIPSFVATT